MIVHETIDQYSEEWWAIRRGLPTASMADKILTPTGKFSTQSVGYACQLIASEVMGNEDEDQVEPNDWMLRGLELEVEARDWLALRYGKQVHEVGFITDNESTRGCSPDGTLKDGDTIGATVEIKCPKGSTHVKYLIDGTLPDYYKPQVHAVMAITNLPLVFVSYHPAFRPLVVKVEPDEYTDKVREAFDTFVKMQNEMRRKIRG